jgi:hypothetical protein
MWSRKESAPPNNEPIKPLIEATRAQIIKDALLIAKGLSKSAQKGHPLAARTMIELAIMYMDIDQAATKRPIRSLALRLAALPQLPPETLGGTTIEPTS